ncbi:hypothetical protein JAAARDRAFT_28153 [Jaapia argillacea MUCL 33604]|uniref:MARVEL domain-containing protein n=1 Tax=Jaapia argillacea MUCL 33604 TaxID=933084 RepID=A0A067QC49_9AGAM|nr:hypothetical protein JAAARDRAFT_28153 [Jaapia argillacea MUCL 33604]
MTALFMSRRLIGYIAVLICSAAELGLASYLASVFLPNIHSDFVIFALIIPCLTILIFLIILQWSQPRIEAFWLFIFTALWLAMGAWSQDLIGGIDCSLFTNMDRTTTKHGTMSSAAYCREMKVIEAFSWMNFVMLAIFLIILLSLTSRSQTLGRPNAWLEPISELPWFNQMPGYYDYYYPNGAAGNQMPYPQGMQMYPQQGVQGGYVVQQMPGSSIVIQPGSNGGPPMINQIPGVVA